MILLVTGAWQDAKNHISELEKMGHEVIFQQYEKDPLPCPAEIIEGIICNGLFLDHKIEQFVNLRYIQLTSAGYDRVPVDYIRDRKIEIHNARGVYSVPMAEYALCGVLVLYKNMRQFLKQQETHVWQKQRNLMELAGSTVMIFGCGSVGRECARVFKAVGCRTIGVDICPIQSSHFSAVKDMVQADRLIGQADVIISALPLVADTHHYFNERRFSLFKRDGIFVNISRGGVVNTTALINALETKKIRGAVLDVFEEEPLDESEKLWEFENVILTPHNSFLGNHNQERLWEVIKKNIDK